jgi:ribosomal-protein-serine acetyltransferase
MFHLSVAPDIELRQIVESDAERLYALTDQNREYLQKWLPWVEHTHSAEDTRHFIAGAVTQFYANRGPNTVILVQGVIAGAIGCHPIDWANRNCSIGYWVDHAQQGKGIITRCCRALLGYLFEELNLHRVVIQCGTGNLKSCAIPQRLDFTREGIARQAEWVNDRWVDLVVWSMLAQDWAAQKSSHSR